MDGGRVGPGFAVGFAVAGLALGGGFVVEGGVPVDLLSLGGGLGEELRELLAGGGLAGGEFFAGFGACGDGG